MVPWSTLLEAYEREKHAVTYARHVAGMNEHLESQLDMLRTSYDTLYQSYNDVLSTQRGVCDKNLDGGPLVEQIWLLKAQIASLVALNNNLQEQCKSLFPFYRTLLTALVSMTPIDDSVSTYTNDYESREVEELAETPAHVEDSNKGEHEVCFDVREHVSVETEVPDQTESSIEPC